MKCLHMNEKVYGAGSAPIGASWTNVGILQEKMGQLDNAVESHLKTLDLYEKLMVLKRQDVGTYVCLNKQF